MIKGNKTKPEEIIRILRSVEVLILQGKTIDLACREAGIARATYYRWCKEFGGMQVNEARELKKQKKENAILKKIIAEEALEKQILKDIIAGKL